MKWISILLLLCLTSIGAASSIKDQPESADDFRDGEFIERMFRFVQDYFRSESREPEDRDVADADLEAGDPDFADIGREFADVVQTKSKKRTYDDSESASPTIKATEATNAPPTPEETSVPATTERTPISATTEGPSITGTTEGPSITGTTAPRRLIIDPNYRQKVLDVHTAERGRLNATNMRHLTWDEELEELAWKRALTCDYNHGDYMLPDGTFVGQNLARFPHGTDPRSHVLTWIYEKRWFDFNTRTCNQIAYCGHYNQMIWHNANRIGCAHQFCPNMGGDYMVCNYIAFGNYETESGTGYPAYEVDGEPCSDCDFPAGTACVDNQCFECDNPQLPEGSVCRPHKAKPCVDLFSRCGSILEDFCKHPSFTVFAHRYCAKFCGFCNW